MSNDPFDSKFEDEVIRLLNELVIIYDCFDDHFENIERNLDLMNSRFTEMLHELTLS